MELDATHSNGPRVGYVLSPNTTQRYTTQATTQHIVPSVGSQAAAELQRSSLGFAG